MKDNVDIKDDIWDEFDIAQHTQLPMEEVKALLKLTGHGYECNGVCYVKKSELNFNKFEETLKKEASAYVRRLMVLEYIEDHPGCSRRDIKDLLEENGSVSHFDVVDLIVTILTEENVDLYEEDDDTLYVRGCDF